MQPRFAKQRSRALTFIEVLVVIAALAVLAALLMPILHGPNPGPQYVTCRNNLKQDAMATRIWADDNNNQYPMQLSVTNGGGMELIATNNVAGFFQVMSNELSTTVVLICPQDKKVVEPTNGFGPGFCDKNISYFAGLDANESSPQRLMFGDDNFEISGMAIPSEVVQISTNAPISWRPGRHEPVIRQSFLIKERALAGNLGFADGSVQEIDSASDLQQALIQTGLATNRLAVP